MDAAETTQEPNVPPVDWGLVWEDFQALPAGEQVELVAHLLDRLPDGFAWVQSCLDLLSYHGRCVEILPELERQSLVIRHRSWTDDEEDEAQKQAGREFVASYVLLQALEDRKADRGVAGRVELMDRYGLFVDEEWLWISLESLFGLVDAEFDAADFRLDGDAPFARIPELTAEMAVALRQADWPTAKTALAVRAMHRYQLEVLQARQSDQPYRTSARRSGSRMRKTLAEACAIVLDPDEFLAFLHDYSFRDAPDVYAKATLIESVDAWLELLRRRELLEKRLARSLRYNLQERLQEEGAAMGDTDAELGECVHAAVDQLY